MPPYVKKRIFPKHEGDFVRDFMTEFKKRMKESCWFFKTHGEPMQARGIPDILMCCYGMFVGIEFKVMRKGRILPTPFQEYNLECINDSNGMGIIVWWDEDNGNVGINMKRFEDKNQAITFLIDILNSYSNLTLKQIMELKNKKSNEKDTKEKGGSSNLNEPDEK
jgi:hypothetical protein